MAPQLAARGLIGPMLLSALLAWLLGRRVRLAGCMPFLWFVVQHRLRPGDPWQELLLAVAQAIAWCGWSVLLFWLSGYLAGVASRGWLRAPGLRWFALTPWGLLLQLHLRHDGADPGFAGKVYIRACWDPPLIWTACAARLTGMRLLRPFYSDIDEEITMGSLPMAQDVQWLRAHGVVAVVNMCAEWAGPKEQYARAGITQLHLPTVDTTSPTLEALLRGVFFINETLALGRGNHRRVFIHCKAGMGRAATMALSWYIFQGMEPERAMKLLEVRRPIVQRKVLEYSVVHDLQHRVSAWRSSRRRDTYWPPDPSGDAEVVASAADEDSLQTNVASAGSVLRPQDEL